MMLDGCWGSLSEFVSGGAFSLGEHFHSKPILVQNIVLYLATVLAFIEGTLTEAVKNGEWIILDKVNMALASVLECLSQLLESEGSITLYEARDYKSIPRHKEFRLFACMNPAKDTGKADPA